MIAQNLDVFLQVAPLLRGIAFPFGRRPKGCLAMLEMTETRSNDLSLHL